MPSRVSNGPSAFSSIEGQRSKSRSV
ncbi:uncharacterized protein METZ01_LOCUS305439, partial [marine metagenome]